MRILIFGDSITQGYWDERTGWPGYLAEYYSSQLLSGENNNPPSVFNLGISADTSKNIVKRFDAEAKVRTKDDKKGIIVFSVGVNNAVVEGGSFWSTPEKYVEDLAELVKMASIYSNKLMFVGVSGCDEKRTMPVSWGDYWYSNERLALFDSELKKFCQVNNLPYINIFNLFTGQGNKFLLDGLHPNTQGHKLIYEKVKPELDKLLNS